jgi:hypothetical protein
MPLPRPPLSARVLVIAGLVVLSVATSVLFARYGLHRLSLELRRRKS